MSTLYQREILYALSRGALIRVEYTNHPPSSAKRVYRLTSNQKLIPEKTVRRMVEDWLLKPNADGLFGNDGPVQSYSLFRASEGGA